MSLNYNQYLGARRCCDLKVQGPQGPQGYQGPAAVGPRGATGASQWSSMNGVGSQGAGYTGIGITGQDVLIYGNLLVTGGIDPTYLALTPQPSGPQGFANPLWVDNSGNLRSEQILLENTITTISSALTTSSLSITDTANNAQTETSTTYFRATDTSTNEVGQLDNRNLSFSNCATGINITNDNGQDLSITASGTLVCGGTNIDLNASDVVSINASNDSINITADDDITLNSISLGIQTISPNGVYINKTTANTGDGTLNTGLITILSTTVSNSSTILNGYDIQTTEQSGSVGNDAIVNPLNIEVITQDFGANTSASASLQQGTLTCNGYYNTVSGDFARIQLTASPIALVGSFFDYTKTAGYPQSYLPFKYNNTEIFRYNANQLLMADTKTIVLSGGGLVNTINGAGYTTRNTTTNATHYLTFSDASGGGVGSIFKTAGISCNPVTNIITATTFSGILSGNATTASNVAGGLGGQVLYQSALNTTAKLTNGNLGQILQANGTTAAPSWVSVPLSTGLVYLQTLTGTITGSTSPVDFNLSSIFDASYANYKIIISASTQVAGSLYPNYSLKAFLGTGTPPTTASLFGYEMLSSASTVVSPVYTSNATIATNPLVFSVSSLINNQVEFDVKNVGFANTANNQVSLFCKSVYNNPGITGSSDRTISATSVNGTVITGLTIQQSIIGLGNNMNWSAIIYGYKR